jgi:hypothetical protein
VHRERTTGGGRAWQPGADAGGAALSLPFASSAACFSAFIVCALSRKSANALDNPSILQHSRMGHACFVFCPISHRPRPLLQDAHI